MKDSRHIAEYALSHRRLRLGFTEHLRYHHSFLILLSAGLFFVYLWDAGATAKWMAIIFYALGTASLLVRISMLRFQEIPTSLNKSQQHSFLESVIRDNFEWEIAVSNEHLIVATTPWSYESNGERVTLVFDDGKVLLNSISDPDKWYRDGFSAFGWNNWNVKILKEYIEAAEP